MLILILVDIQYLQNVVFSFEKGSKQKFSIQLGSIGKPCQMCRDHPFSQRNKVTKRAVRVEIGRGGGGGWTILAKEWQVI